MNQLPSNLVRQRSRFLWLAICSPAILCLLIMLPRLLSPQFGLFDDGNTMRTVQRILSGEWSILRVPWELAAGRIRPAYWLVPMGIDLLAGKNPFWFYVANTLLLCATVGGISWLVSLTGGSTLRAGLTGLLFAVAGPAVESYYTLSKGEALQVACIVGSLLGIVFWGRARTRLGRISWWLGVLALILLGLGSKETGLAILPISAAWLAVGAWRARWTRERKGLGGRAAYFAAALTASATFLGLIVRLRGVPFMKGSYSASYALDLASLVAVFTRWSGWLTRDFGYLIPLGLVVLAAWAFHRHGSLDRVLLDSLIWMGSWVVVFLPWGRFTVEYYLLPFAIGAAGFGAAAVEAALRSIPGAGRGWRTFAVACLALGAVLWLLTIPTNVSNARVQLAVDSANADVLKFIAARAPNHSQVLINIQDPNEYVEEFGMHLSEFFGRGDLTIAPIQVSDPGLGAIGRVITFIAVPEVENTPKLSVRMGVIDATQQAWNNSLDGSIRDRSTEVFRTVRTFRLATFDSPRLLCRFFSGTGYCSGASPLFDTRLFSYGWRVYRLD